MTDLTEQLQHVLTEMAIRLEMFTRPDDDQLMARASWTKPNGVVLHETKQIDSLHTPVDAALDAAAALQDEIDEQGGCPYTQH